MIDKVIKYWNDRPCNIRHSKKKVGTKEYFDDVEYRKYFVEYHIPDFANFKDWKGKDVLEIGCGIGTDTINFARCGANITAIDISNESLKLAKKRAKVFKLTKNIKFIKGNAEDIANVVKNKKFDLIYSFGVLHHTPSPENSIKYFNSLLNKNGKVKIMVYNRYSWKVFWILLKSKFKFWKIKELIMKYSEAQTGCPVTYTYSKNKITEILNKNNLKVNDIKAEHIFPYKISKYKNYIYEKGWYFRIIPNFIFKKIESIFGWHLCITASKI